MDDEPANRSPRFNEGLNTTRTVPENAAIGTAVGAPMTASDPDNDRLEYWLVGSDRLSFDVGSWNGQLSTMTMLDYEEQSEYLLKVWVKDGQGGTDVINLTITVVDVDEPPSQPAAPKVVSAGSTSLVVSWTAPENQGPEITDYDVQYREAQGKFEDVGYDGADTSTTLQDLTPGTTYEVQVRASNAEGASPWSGSGKGETEEALPTPDPVPSPDPAATPKPATTGTPTTTLEPTAAATSTTMATAEPIATSGPTGTPVPTLMPEPVATPTAESDAASAPTPEPTPTSTLAAPSPTRPAEPVPSEADGGDEGFPWWAIVVVVIGVVAGVLLIVVVRRSRR